MQKSVWTVFRKLKMELQLDFLVKLSLDNETLNNDTEILLLIIIAWTLAQAYSQLAFIALINPFLLLYILPCASLPLLHSVLLTPSVSHWCLLPHQILTMSSSFWPAVLPILPCLDTLLSIQFVIKPPRYHSQAR